MIKKEIIFILIIFPFFLNAQNNNNYKYSGFINTGESFPLGLYQSSQSSENPLQIAVSSDFGTNFSFGFCTYFENHFGLSIKYTYNNFELDETKLNEIYEENGFSVSSTISNHTFNKMLAGIVYIFGYKNFYIEPKIHIGLGSNDFSTVNIEYSDTEENTQKQIIYKYFGQTQVSFEGGIDFSYDLFQLKQANIGIQFSTIFSYQKPNIQQEEEIYYYGTPNMEENYTGVSPKISYLYVGTGLIIRL